MASTLRVDRAHDVLREVGRPLDAIFSPRTVGVVGATDKPGSVGRTLLWNLVSSPFGGTVFPINPKRANVLGIKAYRSVADLPEPLDLAVVVTPAAAVPRIIGECADTGVRAAVVISAGFKELGPPGVELERRVLAEARRGRMRIVGPNCLGVMNPTTGLNATFAHGGARAGSVAFLSQSGALLTAILDFSAVERVGFSAIVSTGSMLDVGWGDLIDHFGSDPCTRSILVYMETVGDARSFLSAAREVALSKPIIVIKPGRTEAAARAAASHTGSLTGADEVIDAAFRRAGVLRVDEIGELFDMAEVLAKQPRPRGPNLCVVTNAGGPAVLATDALVARGGRLAALSADTRVKLDALLPEQASRNNPIDVLGDADAERYARTIDVVADDAASDGLLVVLTPQDMTEPTPTAQGVAARAQGSPKPILASFMGGPAVAEAIGVLNAAGVPTFPYPDGAARAFCNMARYAYNLRGLYETPTLADDGEPGAADRERAAATVAAARGEGRTILSESESKRVLAAYGIPTVRTEVAASAEEAAHAAESIGFPVVVKLHSRTVTHKTDVGGVRLGLVDADDVRRAFGDIERAVSERAGRAAFEGVTVQPMIAREGGYELIVGSSLDPQFGPVVLFGTGGQLVEVFRDRSIGLPPLTATLARRMMEQTRIFAALRGVRGRRPVDLPALERMLVAFSHLVVEQRAIAEIDVNPLLVSSDRIVALDARVLVHGPDVDLRTLPRPAIRPYPLEYVGAFRTSDGTEVALRPIRPEDEPLVVAFHERLSERSVRLRYLAPIALDARVAHDRLVRVCFSDYDRDLALVAERFGGGARRREILGVARLAKLPWANEAEFAVLVIDEWQRRGLGTELLRRLVAIAEAEGIERLTAEILSENVEMQRVAARLGFRLEQGPDATTVRAVKELGRGEEQAGVPG